MSAQDGSEIDFSVITKAIKCGGSMLDQIMNGIHYGTSETRSLLLDECDYIIECKVCRALFRALPNFVAHKRVYCQDAYQNPSEVYLPLTNPNHNVESVVVVHPKAPDKSSPVAEPPGKQKNDSSQIAISTPTDTLKNTIDQLTNGTFEGKSKAYQFYTDVAEKSEINSANKQTHYIKHEAIPGNPHAVRVSVVSSEEVNEMSLQNSTDSSESSTVNKAVEERQLRLRRKPANVKSTLGPGSQQPTPGASSTNSLSKNTVNKPVSPKSSLESSETEAMDTGDKTVSHHGSAKPLEREAKNSVSKSVSQQNCAKSSESQAVQNELPNFRSARLRAKTERQQQMEAQQNSTAVKESTSSRRKDSLRDKAKKMFLLPVRKTVTDAKDCDLKRMMCLLCDKKFSNRKCLHYHMRSLHSSKRQVYPCHLCSTILKHRWGLTRHLMRTHALERDEIERIKKERLKSGSFSKPYEGSLTGSPVKSSGEKSTPMKDTSNGKTRSSPLIPDKQNNRKNSVDLERKTRQLINSAKQSTIHNSDKKSRVHSNTSHNRLKTESNDKTKKEFSVKICSKGKSPQFFSGLNLVHCQTCSKTFARKENLTAHAKVCQGAKTVKHSHSLRLTNRRQRLDPSKIVSSETEVDLADGEDTESVTGAIPNAGTPSDKLPPLNDIKVVLEDCKLKQGVETQGDETKSNNQENGENVNVAVDLLDLTDCSSKSSQANSETIPSETDANNSLVNDCAKLPSGVSTPSKKEAEPLIQSLSSNSREQTPKKHVSEEDSESMSTCQNSISTETVGKRIMPKRASTSQKCSEPNSTSLMGSTTKKSPVKASEAGVQACGLSSSPESLKSDDVDDIAEEDDESPEEEDLEVSFISDDELLSMQQRVEAQMGQQISAVSKELLGNHVQKSPAKRNRSKTDGLRSVEEIWIGKAPGKPTEKLKSNRTYVLDLNVKGKGGKPYCQDSKRVDEIIDRDCHQCKECGEAFASVCNLRRHAIRHLGWIRYKCNLCSHGSYHKSEMKSHLARVHEFQFNTEDESFLNFCMVDLGKEGSRIRAEKRQQTLSSRQSATTNNKTALKRRATEDNGPSVIKRSASKATVDRRKPAVNPKNIVDPDPKRFNISTRNSPRIFDVRPVKTADTMQTLFTRKGFYPKEKRNITQTSDASLGGLGSVAPEIDSSEESRSSTPTVPSKSKTRSIDFRKTRGVDNPWAEGFYKRLSGGSLGALKKEQSGHLSRSKSCTSLKSGSPSKDRSSSSHSPNKPSSPARSSKTETTSQKETNSACKNVATVLKNQAS